MLIALYIVMGLFGLAFVTFMIMLMVWIVREDELERTKKRGEH